MLSHFRVLRTLKFQSSPIPKDGKDPPLNGLNITQLLLNLNAPLLHTITMELVIFPYRESGIADAAKLPGWQVLETLFSGPAFPALTRVVIIFSIEEIILDSPPLRKRPDEEEVITLISNSLPLLSASGRLVFK